MKFIKQSKPCETKETKKLSDSVCQIIDEVRINGDKALIKYNALFDNNNRENLRVSRHEIEEAYDQVSSEIIADIKTAAKNIEKFAQLQKKTMGDLNEKEIYPGVFLGHRTIPLESCCCYVPGGSYPLFSTALMLATPAKIAGVKRITACSPAIKGKNKVHPATLVALDIAGVDEIYAIGGSHAIAALAYGTDQIKPVDLIVGPGNQYVTEAKRQCYGQVGIDFVAGPSEVLIIADESAHPEILAADLLGQSEHDVLAKGILVTTNEQLGLKTIKAIESQLQVLPTEKIARFAWKNNGEIILADSIEEACNISNEYAPEHLELVVNDTAQMLPLLRNYGSLFIGELSAEVFGDYVSGTNHTLPTLRASRYTGGVWVGTFTKVCTHQRLTKEAIQALGPVASRMAKYEGLYAHANAAEIRLKLIDPIQ